MKTQYFVVYRDPTTPTTCKSVLKLESRNGSWEGFTVRAYRVIGQSERVLIGYREPFFSGEITNQKITEPMGCEIIHTICTNLLKTSVIVSKHNDQTHFEDIEDCLTILGRKIDFVPPTQPCHELEEMHVPDDDAYEVTIRPIQEEGVLNG